jgi:hypothetical protein
MMRVVKKFVAYYYFVGWDCLSLGFHVCPSQPNIEIHLPFGFIRIGWLATYPGAVTVGPSDDWFNRRTFGYQQF